MIASTGSHPYKMNDIVGPSISLMEAFPTLLERYRSGAHGGVIFPIPRLTPTMAAKW